MNTSNIAMQLIYYFVASIILYFLLPKLNLKSLKWIAETSKRKIITWIIFIILSGVAAGTISSINSEYINAFTFVPLAIFAAISNRIRKLSEEFEEKKIA